MIAREFKYEILKSFHEQFAQNQNHHQNLFIKFLSAVLIVIAAYFFVYIKTTNKADFWDISYFTNSENIISYAKIHLIGAYLLAQIIFNIMTAIILNMGYNFRRDQKVNYNIRRYYLGKSLYKDIYGEMSFNPCNLGFWDYLPGFHKIFYTSILLLQFVFFISVVLKFNLINAPWINIFLFIYLFPLFYTLFLYPIYYKKYCKKVKSV